jgi:hypothetical protein
MKTLAILFGEAKRLPPGEQPAYVSSRLCEALSGSHLNYWRLEDSVPYTGRRTLIGIAPYALADLELLDSLEQSLSKKAGSDERIDVLDVLTCTTMDDFERCLPGVGKVFQTPVVGVWENRVVGQRASGAAARRLIISRYDLNCGK